MSGLYHIRVKGHLSEDWSDWFDGLTINNLENGEALLTGTLVDQSSLYGVLNRLQTLNVPLMSVFRIDEAGSEQVIEPPPSDDGTDTIVTEAD